MAKKRREDSLWVIQRTVEYAWKPVGVVPVAFSTKNQADWFARDLKKRYFINYRVAEYVPKEG